MHRATGLTRSGEDFALWLEDGRSISARTVILATGASYRRLGIAELEELTGAGVFYGGPVSEAPTLAGRRSTCSAAATPRARPRCILPGTPGR